MIPQKDNVPPLNLDKLNQKRPLTQTNQASKQIKQSFTQFKRIESQENKSPNLPATAKQHQIPEKVVLEIERKITQIHE